MSRTFGILAVRGAGKSNTAAVMAEEMFSAGLPFVVVDPVGSWYGLRSSEDGTAPGLQIPIFGGKHGDVPLERGAGELIADLVVEKRLTCVLDLSRFESESAKKSFLLAFAQRLYLKNENPLHLFLEEADDYIPQKPMRDEAYLLRAWENIVRRGRSRGLGMTLITQRSASINKMVLTQVETLFAMRTTGPQDIAAIEAWVKYHQAGREVLSTLSSLEDGEAWVWSPHFLKTMSRHQIRRRSTFDSGATPKNVRAKDTRPPATLADIDLSAIQKSMSETIEKAKADDPRELRKRIAELEKQAEEHVKQSARNEPIRQVKRVEVLTDADRALLDNVSKRLAERSDILKAQWLEVVAEAERVVVAAVTRCWSELVANRYALTQELEETLERVRFQNILGKLATVQAPEPIKTPTTTATAVRPNPHGRRAEPGDSAARPAPVVPPQSSNGHVELGRVHRAFLTVLANRQHKRTYRNQLALMSRYSPASRHVDKAIGELREAGYLEGSSADMVISPAGLAALGTWEAYPTGPDLVEYWIRESGAAPGAMLRALVDVYPRTLSRDEIAQITGYSVTSRHVDKTIGYLRTRELVSGDRAALKASDELFS